jgi:hypothetical protein
MDNLLNPEQLSELDAEQESWTNADRVSALGCFESLMEMRFLSSCTNVSRV